MLKIFFLSCIISFVLAFVYKIVAFFMQMKINFEVYSIVLEAYDDMQLARKEFYNARFEEDEFQREQIQKCAQELYDLCVNALDSDWIHEAINDLPKHMQEEALNIINSPRYGLF